jgi:epoxyqueuosine reductase
MDMKMQQLANEIKDYGLQLGFQQVGISDIDLNDAEKKLQQWLANGFHADMDYMARHGTKRSRPAELLPGMHSDVTITN